MEKLSRAALECCWLRNGKYFDEDEICGVRGKNADELWGRGVVPVLQDRSGDSAYSKDVGVTNCQSWKSVSLACGAGPRGDDQRGSG